MREPGFDIAKTWTVNGGVLAFAWLSEIEAVLKVLVLTETLVWTVSRTVQLVRQMKQDKNK